MFRYGKKSAQKLSQCHPLLQFIMNEAIKLMDIEIKDGYRSKKRQNEAYSKGYSKLKYPNSKHNKKPALAVDAVPYPGGYKSSKHEYEKLSLIIKAIAISHGIPLKWGGDWKSFVDKPHYQLKGSLDRLNFIWENIQLGKFVRED